MTSHMEKFLKMAKNLAKNNAKLLTTQEKAAVMRYCAANVADRNESRGGMRLDRFSQLRLVPLKHQYSQR